MAKQTFFIVSSVRSGSTAMAEMCNMAINCRCEVEPDQSAKYVILNLMQNPSYDPCGWLKNLQHTINGNTTDIYGQKDPIYGPLIPYLYDEFKCKFIYLIRNPLDVVTSMLNWNQQTTGMLYAECKEPIEYSDKAKKFRQGCNGKIYVNDVIRPRPSFDEEIFYRWKNLSRAEMYAFYWKRTNDIILHNLERLPTKDVLSVRMGKTLLIKGIVDFLGLKGIDINEATKFMQSRHNSTEQRGFGSGDTKSWHEWDEQLREKVLRILDDSQT